MVKNKIKKYVMDEKLSWEERYKQLEAHHEEETTHLIDQIESLEDDISILEAEIDELRFQLQYDR